MHKNDIPTNKSAEKLILFFFFSSRRAETLILLNYFAKTTFVIYVFYLSHRGLLLLGKGCARFGFWIWVRILGSIFGREKSNCGREIVGYLRIVGGMNLRMQIIVDIRNERRRSEREREMAIAGVEREISEQSSSHGGGFCLGFC